MCRNIDTVILAVILFVLTNCSPKNQVKLVTMKALEETKVIGEQEALALENPEKLIKLSLLGGAKQSTYDRLGEFKNLQYLSLSTCELDEIPKAVFQLKHLQWLDIESNKISALPERLFDLKNLRKLNIGDNPFQALPSGIGQLSKLEYIGLANSKVQSYPKEFAKLQKLREVMLQSANVTTLPEEFGQLGSLERIYLNFNPQLDAHQALKVLSKLPKLEEVIMYASGVNTFPPEVVNLKALKKLYLGGQQLNLKQIVPLLGKLPALTYLYLDEIKEIPSDIQLLNHLDTLIVMDAETRNEDVGLLFSNLKGATSLAFLLFQSDYVDAIPTQIGELGTLKKLNNLRLRGNKLSTLPEAVTQLKNLQILDLEINKFSEDEKARIKKLLPHVEVKF